MEIDAVTAEKARKEFRDLLKELLAYINLVRCVVEGSKHGMGDIFIDVLIEDLHEMKTKEE